MAGSGHADLEAALLIVCKQQEAILKCVQSLQTGRGHSIGERLGRLDDKVDMLLASNALSRGQARMEELTENPLRREQRDALPAMAHDGVERDVPKDRREHESPGEIVGEAAGSRESSVSSDEATLRSIPVSPSFSVPRSVIEDVDEPGSPAYGSPSIHLPHSVVEDVEESGSPPYVSSSILLPHSINDADESISPPKSPSFPRFTHYHQSLGRSIGSKATTRSRWTARKSRSKLITKKKRRDQIAKQPRLARIAGSVYFEVLCAVMIILNVLNICWQTQITASGIEDAFVSGAVYSNSVPARFVAVQSFFTFFFLVEVGIRWAARGFTRFLNSSGWTWNWLDILTVSAGLVLQVLQYFQMHTALGIIYAVRCLRILRLLRVFRTLRLFVFFRELRMLIGACIGGLKSYLWCCFINLFLLLVFGITLTTRTYTHILTSEQYADDEGARLLQGSFGTLDKSMLSLAQAVSGGRDWYELYDLLKMVGAVDCLLLLTFLSFSIYVFANAAAAIFVEGAINKAKQDTELIIKQQLEKGSEFRRKLFDVFDEMDLDDNGTLTLEEFTSHLDDDRVIAYFDAFQLDACYATEIFMLLDVDGSGRVDIHDFINGCIKLRGEAKHLQLCLVQREITSINENINNMQAFFARWPSSNAAPIQGGHLGCRTGGTWPGFDVPESPIEGATLSHALGRQLTCTSLATES